MIRRSRRLLLSALGPFALVLLVWQVACDGARPATESFPRIVLVTLDTLHIDHTGVFNPEIADTPALDRFASEGLVFDQARTTAPMTLPAHTSLLSGRTPLGLGLLRNGEVVPAEVETVAQRLQAAGYTTGAFLSLATLHGRFGLDRGFDVYDDRHGSAPRFYRTADEVYAAASRWIGERGEPYFLWVHFSDPHEPFVQVGAPPDVSVELDGAEVGRFNLATKEIHSLTVALDPGSHRLRWISLREPRPDDRPDTSHRLGFRENTDLIEYLADWHALPSPDIDLDEPFALALENEGDERVEVEVRFHGSVRMPPRSEVLENYSAEVRYADRYVGKLRELVEREGEALWIVASDHGEGIYRRERIIGHAGFGFEDQLRILWMMKGPGIPVGSRIDSSVALTHDIAPTLLDVLGLPPLEEAEGLSFKPCWERGECVKERSWFAHGYNRGRAKLSAVATYRWPLKLLQQDGAGVEGYDLLADSWERSPLDREGTAGVALDLRRLQRELNEVGKVLRKGLSREAGELSDEDLEMLRSLGYLN